MAKNLFVKAGNLTVSGPITKKLIREYYAVSGRYYEMRK
jgi:hypothetical protein